MALTTYNCTALTGGAARALDSYSVGDLVDGDRAICAVGGKLLYFIFDATATDAEDVSSHPYKVRPDDYTSQGVWVEQVTVENPVTAGVAITDNRLVRGDGGARGVQECSVAVSDDGEMTNTNQPAFLVKPASNQEDIAVGSSTTVVLGTEIYDQGNNFASNIFTAPVTGKYSFQVMFRLNNLDAGATYYQLYLITSNRTFAATIDPDGFDKDLAYISLPISIIADMDASDTAYLAAKQSGGAAQTDIEATETFFSGALIC